MEKRFRHIASKEVTRGEFLKILGVGAVSIFGFSTIVEYVLGEKYRPQSQNNYYYGTGLYSGNKEG